jgi:hypothetical protein
VEGAVPGGSGLALGGFGAGREPGVAAVGLDLSLGRHSTLRLQGKPGRGGCRGHGSGKWLRGREKKAWRERGMEGRGEVWVRGRKGRFSVSIPKPHLQPCVASVHVPREFSSFSSSIRASMIFSKRGGSPKIISSMFL